MALKKSGAYFAVAPNQPAAPVARAASPEHMSSSTSTVSLESVQYSKLTGLPEEWTLPHERVMECRERFGNWKTDVQCQIANIANKLDVSLRHNPQVVTSVMGDNDVTYTADADESHRALMERLKTGSQETNDLGHRGLKRGFVSQF